MTMMKWAAVCFYFVLLGRTPLLAFLFATDSVPSPTATIQPKDVLVFRGETLRVECKLNNTSAEAGIRVSNLFFMLHAGYTSWTVPANMTDTIDDRTIATELQITEKFINYTTLQCREKDRILPLDSTFINVEVPLRNVSNFGGVAQYDSSVKFTWELRQEYLHLEWLKVTVDWSPNSAPNESGNICNTNNETKESCKIDFLSGQDLLFVRVNVSTLRDRRPSEEFLTPLYDTQAVSIHRFVVAENLKTSAPSFFNVNSTTSTCVNISWKDPLYFDNCMCPSIYQVEVTSQSSLGIPVITLNGSKPANSSGEVIPVCGLKPYTHYRFSVKVKPRDMNPWSDEVFVEATTEEDRPDSGPPVTDTSFHVGDCQLDKTRKIYLYWKDPEAGTVNGELTGYEIEFDNDTKLLRRGSNYYQDYLECERPYTITINAATKIGPSLHPSSIIIPAEYDTISVPDDFNFLVEENSHDDFTTLKNLSITWSNTTWPAKGEDLILVFYRCQKAYADSTCYNDFETIDVNISDEKLDVRDLQVTEDMFGYALKTKTGHMRGVEWTECVYRADKKPVKIPVSAKPGRAAGSLEVSWVSTRCSRSSRILTKSYHINICSQPIDSNQDIDQFCKEYIVPSTNGFEGNSYTATDLIPGREYYVYVKAESPAGLGDLSKMASSRAGIEDSSFDAKLPIIMSVLIFAIGLGFVLFCVIRRCRKSQRHYSSMVKKSGDLFKVHEHHMNDSISDESGIGSSGSQHSSGQHAPDTPPPLPSLPADGLPPVRSNPGEARDAHVTSREEDEKDPDVTERGLMTVPGVLGATAEDETVPKELEGFVNPCLSTGNQGSAEYIRFGIKDSSGNTTGSDRSRRSEAETMNIQATVLRTPVESEETIVVNLDDVKVEHNRGNSEGGEGVDEGYGSPGVQNDSPVFTPTFLMPSNTQTTEVEDTSSSDLSYQSHAPVIHVLTVQDDLDRNRRGLAAGYVPINQGTSPGETDSANSKSSAKAIADYVGCYLVEEAGHSSGSSYNSEDVNNLSNSIHDGESDDSPDYVHQTIAMHESNETTDRQDLQADTDLPSNQDSVMTNDSVGSADEANMAGYKTVDFIQGGANEVPSVQSTKQSDDTDSQLRIMLDSLCGASDNRSKQDSVSQDEVEHETSLCADITGSHSSYGYQSLDFIQGHGQATDAQNLEDGQSSSHRSDDEADTPHNSGDGYQSHEFINGQERAEESLSFNDSHRVQSADSGSSERGDEDDAVNHNAEGYQSLNFIQGLNPQQLLDNDGYISQENMENVKFSGKSL